MTADEVSIHLIVGYDDTNPDQAPELMIVSDNFYPIIGRLVIQWAVMEQQAEALTASLLEFNKTAEAGWRRRGFAKRWSLLRREFLTFCLDEPDLVREFEKLDHLVKEAKPLRDGIAHRRITSNITQTSCHLRFEMDDPANPWSEAYSLKDIEDTLDKVIDATGGLFRLLNPDHPTCASLPGKSLLRSLPNMDHLSFPVPPAPQPRPGS